MESQRTKNALLFVIALCLVLIVLKLYPSGSFVREAQAQQQPVSPDLVAEAHLFGCLRLGHGRPPSCVEWLPVKVDDAGNLLVATQ